MTINKKTGKIVRPKSLSQKMKANATRKANKIRNKPEILIDYICMLDFEANCEKDTLVYVCPRVGHAPQAIAELAKRYNKKTNHAKKNRYHSQK